MYIGKVFWGLKSSILHSTGNTFCFHISTAISSSTSVGIFEGRGQDRDDMAYLGLATLPSLDQLSSGLLKLLWAPRLSYTHDYLPDSCTLTFISSCPQNLCGDISHAS